MRSEELDMTEKNKQVIEFSFYMMLVFRHLKTVNMSLLNFLFSIVNISSSLKELSYHLFSSFLTILVILFWEFPIITILLTSFLPQVLCSWGIGYVLVKFWIIDKDWFHSVGKTCIHRSSDYFWIENGREVVKQLIEEFIGHYENTPLLC